MPIGRYHLLDGAGHHVASEDFRCAPGPMGWRYVGTVQRVPPSAVEEIVDLSVDAHWQPVRLRIEATGHTLLIGVRDGRLGGMLDRSPMELPWNDRALLHYGSPCFLVAAANRLAAATEPADVDIVLIEPPTLYPMRARFRYAPGPEEIVHTPAGSFRGRRWTLSSGEGGDRALWVAGDVVLGAEGLVELVAMEPGATGPKPLAPP